MTHTFRQLGIIRCRPTRRIGQPGHGRNSNQQGCTNRSYSLLKGFHLLTLPFFSRFSFCVSYPVLPSSNLHPIMLLCVLSLFRVVQILRSGLLSFSCRKG